MLPHRWRTPSSLTISAKMSDSLQVLRNGIDRKWDGVDNGIWVKPNSDAITYTWKKPVNLNGARIIFDSNLKVKSKRMPKFEALTERVKMPAMMAKSFRIEARVNGQWTTVYEDANNFLRLRKVFFNPVKADGMRLIVNETWGAETAHVFALDAL